MGCKTKAEWHQTMCVRRSAVLTHQIYPKGHNVARRPSEHLPVVVDELATHPRARLEAVVRLQQQTSTHQLGQWGILRGRWHVAVPDDVSKGHKNVVGKTRG